MNSLRPLLSLNISCDESLARLKEGLPPAGLRLVQTFDLQVARLTLEDCPCPHHGTTSCDCQMIVLLVYGNMAEPATLILHGSDGQTWLSLVDTPMQKTDPKTAGAIKAALAMAMPVGPSRHASA